MQIEIKIPSVGESVQEAVLAQWYKNDGDAVLKDEPLFVIETDKVTLEVTAEAAGVLHISVAEGQTVPIGAVVGTLDTAAAEAPAGPPAEEKTAAPSPAPEPGTGTPPATAPQAPPAEATSPAPAAPQPESTTRPDTAAGQLPPSVRRLAAERQLDVSAIPGSGPGGRVTKGDVLLYLEQGGAQPLPAASAGDAGPVAPAAVPGIRRESMSPIRRRIAERLLEARRNTAMLTTFNEIDMQNVMTMRARYKEAFAKKHGVSLGFMSFFIKASIEALKAFPAINAFIEDHEIVYHDYCHIGVAVGSERGLVVPVIHHAETLSFAQIERAIVDLVQKIKANRLTLSDLEGGTFTISNGGVYGSLLSTPILNTPQSGILGMHKIEKRPVVDGDEIVIRPMMYVALSYDHRIVDGREAVSCLKHIKELVENPERIMMEI